MELMWHVVKRTIRHRRMPHAYQTHDYQVINFLSPSFGHWSHVSRISQKARHAWQIFSCRQLLINGGTYLLLDSAEIRFIDKPGWIKWKVNGIFRSVLERSEKVAQWDLTEDRGFENMEKSRKSVLARYVTVLQWLPVYTRMQAFEDFIAGLTVGLTIVPQSLAYAALAGLSAQVYTNFRDFDPIWKFLMPNCILRNRYPPFSLLVSSFAEFRVEHSIRDTISFYFPSFRIENFMRN